MRSLYSSVRYHHGGVAEEVVRIAGAQRADDGVVLLVGVLRHPEPPQLARRDVQLGDRGATGLEEPLLEVRVQPGPRDDPGAVVVVDGRQLPAPLLELSARDPAPLQHRVGEGSEQAVGVGQLGVQPLQPLLEGARAQPACGDPEELVVVATLFAGLVDRDRRRPGVRDRDRGDPPDQLVELVLDVTDGSVGVLPDPVPPRGCVNGAVGTQQVGEGDDAAPQEVQDARLQALAAEVLEVGLHRGDVTLGTVDVGVCAAAREPVVGRGGSAGAVLGQGPYLRESR